MAFSDFDSDGEVNWSVLSSFLHFIHSNKSQIVFSQKQWWIDDCQDIIHQTHQAPLSLSLSLVFLTRTLSWLPFLFFLCNLSNNWINEKWETPTLETPDLEILQILVDFSAFCYGYKLVNERNMCQSESYLVSGSMSAGCSILSGGQHLRIAVRCVLSKGDSRIYDGKLLCLPLDIAVWMSLKARPTARQNSSKSP